MDKLGLSTKQATLRLEPGHLTTDFSSRVLGMLVDPLLKLCLLQPSLELLGTDLRIRRSGRPLRQRQSTVDGFSGRKSRLVCRLPSIEAVLLVGFSFDDGLLRDQRRRGKAPCRIRDGLFLLLAGCHGYVYAARGDCVSLVSDGMIVSQP